MTGHGGGIKFLALAVPAFSVGLAVLVAVVVPSAAPEVDGDCQSLFQFHMRSAGGTVAAVQRRGGKVPVDFEHSAAIVAPRLLFGSGSDGIVLEHRSSKVFALDAKALFWSSTGSAVHSVLWSDSTSPKVSPFAIGVAFLAFAAATLGSVTLCTICVVGRGKHRGDPSKEQTAAPQPQLMGDSVRVICGCRTTGNMRVLARTAALFTVLTAAQLIAALRARSAALLADSVSMGVLSATYLLNIFAESMRGNRCHRSFELGVAAVSQSVLVILTLGILQESLPNVHTGEQSQDHIDPVLVLVFSIGGLLADGFSLRSFLKNQKRSGERIGVNMTAALNHVGADFARSFTTLIEAVLILCFNFNGTKTDARACMLVGFTILFGAVISIFQWAKEFIHYVQTGQ